MFKNVKKDVTPRTLSNPSSSWKNPYVLGGENTDRSHEHIWILRGDRRENIPWETSKRPRRDRKSMGNIWWGADKRSWEWIIYTMPIIRASMHSWEQSTNSKIYEWNDEGGHTNQCWWICKPRETWLHWNLVPENHQAEAPLYPSVFLDIIEIKAVGPPCFGTY